MANVLHRTTGQFLQSVNTPDYKPSEWVINPNLTLVKNVPLKFWVIDGNAVREMTPAEKMQMVFPKEIAAKAKFLAFEMEAYIDQHYDTGQKASLTAAWVEGSSKGYQKRAARVEKVWTWVKAVIDYFYARYGAIVSAQSFEQLEAVAWDFSGFDAVDPHVSVSEVKKLNE